VKNNYPPRSPQRKEKKLTIPRLYSTEILQGNETVWLPADNLHYLKNVLRLQEGAGIVIFDSAGHEYEAVITQYSAAGVEVRTVKQIGRAEREIRITLAQALPKAGKMDFIVKTAAELGADLIIPFVASRSVSRMTADKAAQKVSRWGKIALEASRVSRAAGVAQVDHIKKFDAMLKSAAPPGARMIFWEEEQEITLKDVLTDKSLDGCRNYFIIVGPEGGLAKEEIAQAKEAGFLSVSLGRRILKVETAAAAIMAIIQYEKGVFSHTSLLKRR